LRFFLGDDGPASGVVAKVLAREREVPPVVEVAVAEADAVGVVATFAVESTAASAVVVAIAPVVAVAAMLALDRACAAAAFASYPGPLDGFVSIGCRHGSIRPRVAVGSWAGSVVAPVGGFGSPPRRAGGCFSRLVYRIFLSIGMPVMYG
jgi:hypothetical protein